MKIKPVITIIFISLISLLYVSCNDNNDKQENEDIIKIDHHGSVDIIMSQLINDTTNIITTSNSYYDNSGLLIKTTIYSDTLKSLGNIKDTIDTGRTVEDENGDNQPIDSIIVHKKSYQFFIKIK